MTLNEFTQLSILVFIGIVTPLTLLHLFSEARTHRGLRSYRPTIQKISRNPFSTMPNTGFCTSDPNWIDLLYSAMQEQLKFREAELQELWEDFDREDRQAFIWDLLERKKILRKLNESRNDLSL